MLDPLRKYDNPPDFINERPSEWEELQRAPGQDPGIRHYQWDNVHNLINGQGPKIPYSKVRHGRFVRPVP